MFDWTLSKPAVDADKARNIVCAIIQASGGEFKGKTRLNKVFWWAHVYHYKRHAGLLSQYPIARLPEGPCIDDADDLLADLEKNRRITMATEQVGPQHFENQYALVPGTEISLDADEWDSVKKAVEWAGRKLATTISKESHRLSQGWQRAVDGDIIDIANDALSDDELQTAKADVEAIQDRVKRAKSHVLSVFGGDGVGSFSQSV